MKLLARQSSNKLFLRGYTQLLTLTGVNQSNELFPRPGQQLCLSKTTFTRVSYRISSGGTGPSGKRFKEAGGDHSRPVNAKDVNSWLLTLISKRVFGLGA